MLVLKAKANAANDSLKVIFKDDEQSEADALARAGYLPDALRVVFVSPIDERL